MWTAPPSVFCIYLPTESTLGGGVKVYPQLSACGRNGDLPQTPVVQGTERSDHARGAMLSKPVGGFLYLGKGYHL